MPVRRSDLHHETLQQSGRQEYMTADSSCLQIDSIKQQEKAFRLATEQARQRDEKGNLEKVVLVVGTRLEVYS